LRGLDETILPACLPWPLVSFGPIEITYIDPYL
jgi:hypothetical protein